MSHYYSDEPQSNFGLYFFLGVIAIGLVVTGLLVTQCSPDDTDVAKIAPEEKKEAPEKLPDEPVIEPVPEVEDVFNAEKTEEEKTSAEILTAAGMGSAELDPEALLQKIGEALEAKELESAAALIGKEALNESHLEGLRVLAEADKLRMRKMQPISEIGELEANRRARWALNLDDEVGSRIYFDLARQLTGKWSVEKVTLPPNAEEGEFLPRALFADALGTTDAFLACALEQSFDDAKSFVDPGKVSDAKIAGLCIIFEEAKYKLRYKKPLRVMFNRDTSAGFMVHVEDEAGVRAAEFGINVQRPDDSQPWRVTEINLDQLLADYATRVAGGDVHFTPLVKNPSGGDTLILYFGFDEEILTPRTTRQLDIVASLLKIDIDKKLTLSGHTDALGSDDYNTELSAKRAEAVKKYLLTVGVPPTQMVTLAEGEAKPRRPNVTDDGEDDPTGRRANRRTEIYLDF